MGKLFYLKLCYKLYEYVIVQMLYFYLPVIPNSVCVLKPVNGSIMEKVYVLPQSFYVLFYCLSHIVYKFECFK